MNDNTNDTSLVPVDPWQGILGQAYDGSMEKVLSAHFRNGLEELTVDASTLERQKSKLEESRRKDAEMHKVAVLTEKADFKEKNRLLARLTRKVVFIEPDHKPSLETSVYEKAVEVGQTLTEYLDNLRKFASQFSVLGERYQKLCEQQTELELRREQIERRASTYENEERLTADFIGKVTGYSSLADADQDALAQSVREATNGVDISDENVREIFVQQLKRGQFTLRQTHITDQADHEEISIRLASVSRQLEGVNKDAGRLWDLYNPARTEAVHLSVTYQELSSAAETGTAIYGVAQMLGSARELCESAREMQDALEAAVEGQLEVLSAFRGVNDGRGSYQLSTGDTRRGEE